MHGIHLGHDLAGGALGEHLVGPLVALVVLGTGLPQPSHHIGVVLAHQRDALRRATTPNPSSEEGGELTQGICPLSIISITAGK